MDSDRRDLILTGLAAAALGMAPRRTWAAEVPPEPSEDQDLSLPVETDRYDHMTAMMLVNEQGPFPFLIDTGANMSCVSVKLAEALRLPAGAPVRVHTALGARMQPTVKLARLQVGARNRRAVTAPALKLWSGPQMGVLGVDWLANQRLALNFKAQTVEISRSQADRSEEGKIVVKARRRHGQLTIVDADLGEIPVSCMLDSGSQVTACNDALRDLLNARRMVTAAPQRIGLESLTGESFHAEMIHLPFLRLGGIQLGHVPVAHVNLHAFDVWGLQKSPALLLGMDLLRQFSCVTLDFGKSTVRFDV